MGLDAPSDLSRDMAAESAPRTALPTWGLSGTGEGAGLVPGRETMLMVGVVVAETGRDGGEEDVLNAGGGVREFGG